MKYSLNYQMQIENNLLEGEIFVIDSFEKPRNLGEDNYDEERPVTKIVRLLEMELIQHLERIASDHK